MKKLISNEKLGEFFQSAEKDYAKIFNALLDERVLSPEKAVLLTRKLGLTSYNYYNFIDTLEEKLAKRKKLGKLNFLLSNIFLIILFTLFLFTGSTWIYLAINGLCVTSYLGKKEEKEANNTYKELNNHKKELLILIDNCNRLLDSKTSIYYKSDLSMSQEKTETRNLIKANKYIQIYLDNEFLPEIDLEIQDLMIKILQEEFKTEEVDLKVLLEMAKEEIAFETLKNESELIRILTKNDENNKK